jgi:hypothetical protein
MRATPGFYTGDAIRGQDALPDQELGILARVDVVGDDGQIDTGPERPAQGVHQRRLPAADRTGHADTKRAIYVFFQC